MIGIEIVFIGIVVLFALFTLLRSVSFLKVCALCASVFTSWVLLLALYYIYVKYQVDGVLVGILMGGSIVGSMYLLEEKMKERYTLFKLPYFLTLVLGGYVLLTGTLSLQALGVVALLWLAMVLIDFGKKRKGVGVMWRKIIECCKNW